MAEQPTDNQVKNSRWMTISDALWLIIAIGAAAAGTWQAEKLGSFQRIPLLLFVVAFLAAFTFSLRRARRRFLNRKNHS